MNAHFWNTLQCYTALTGSTWIPFHPSNSSTIDHEASRHLVKQYCCDGKSSSGQLYWDKPYFLCTLQWYTVLTGFNWIPFHPCKSMFWPLILHQTSNTFWAHCSSRWCWLTIWIPCHPSKMLYYGPQRSLTRGNWKTNITTNGSQHFYWIKPWLYTFGAHYSGTDCWMTITGHLFTHGRCSITDHRPLLHLENHFCHKCQSKPSMADQLTAYVVPVPA